MDAPALGTWLLKEGGLIGVLMLIIWCGYKEIWVWGRVARKQVGDLEKRIAELEAAMKEQDARHEREKAELKENQKLWQSTALRTTSLAELASGLIVKGAAQ